MDLPCQGHSGVGREGLFCEGTNSRQRASVLHSCIAGAMDEVTAAYLHEEGLPYFTMFGQGISPYKDLKGDTCKHSCLSAAIAGAPLLVLMCNPGPVRQAVWLLLMFLGHGRLPCFHHGLAE